MDKACDQRLPAPIRRIFYLSSEGDTREHEVAPSPNPRVLAELQRADAVVFAMGSLYTSLAPSLVLRGVGECLAARECPKVRACACVRLQAGRQARRGAPVMQRAACPTPPRPLRCLCSTARTTARPLPPTTTAGR